jgi:hypothetical protein
MRNRDSETLVEASLTAHRERDTRRRIRPSSAWCDLAPAERDAAFALQLESRRLERALDEDGWSSTARAVLDRLDR